jgi:hypothetical protein
VNVVEIRTHENGKVGLVETISVVGRGRIKENDGGHGFNYDIL